MPVQIIEPSTSPEATYKAREVEGILDLYFYRKIGFWLAQFFARLSVTPTGVSLFGAFCGVIAGHLYFYRNLSTNIIGMALHVFANALDNADGQLARRCATACGASQDSARASGISVRAALCAAHRKCERILFRSSRRHTAC